MLLILPFIAYGVWFLLFEILYTSRREAALAAAAWWTLELVFITETLSLDRALARYPLAIGWLCTTGLLAVAVFVARGQLQSRRQTVTLPKKLSIVVPTWGAADWVMVGGVSLVSLLVGITALVSPPNGSDQLQYHLPRVVEWASRRSVGFFPTHYYVQLFAPPLAEWTMLHSYILTGGDHFVGLVQWFAFLGSAVGVSLIAKELGASFRGQLLAALLCVTLPQGILAASGAKNDWVLAFWLAAVVFFLIQWFRAPDWLTTCNLGISIGAALLAKGTVYAFLPPILAAASIWGLRFQWRTVLKRAPAVIALVLLMNGPQWARNYSLGGSILGLSSPDVAGKEKYSVDQISLRGIVSNSIRELAMHLGTSIDSVNQRETKIVRAVITSIGANPDDPALTNYSNFEIPHSYFENDEYYAGNPLHFALGLLAFITLLIVWRGRSAGTIAVAVGIIGGFVLYCSLFKWEIWCARLHLPLFVVASAVVAVVICQSFPKLVFPLAIVAVTLAVPPTVFNSSRPLLFGGGIHHGSIRTSIFLQSRPELYFTQQAALKATYIPAARVISDDECNDVGIDTSVRPYSHEYPLLELGRAPNRQKRFRYVDVENLSSKYSDKSDSVTPCLVICPACLNRKDKWEEYSPVLPVARAFGDLVIFTRKPSL
jgi:hypothetical protein